MLHQALRGKVFVDSSAIVKLHAIGHIHGATARRHLHQLAFGRAEVATRGAKRPKSLHLAGLHIYRCDVVVLQAGFRIWNLSGSAVGATANHHDGSLNIHDRGTKGNIRARLPKLRPLIGIGIVREQGLIAQQFICTGSRKRQELPFPQRKANRCVLIDSIAADLDTRQASHSLPGSGLYAITIERLEGKTRLKILVQGFKLGEGVDIAVKANELGALNLIGELKSVQGNRLLEQRNIALWRVLGETHNHRAATRFPRGGGKHHLALAGGYLVGNLHFYRRAAPASHLRRIAANGYRSIAVSEVSAFNNDAVGVFAFFKGCPAYNGLGFAAIVELGQIQNAVRSAFPFELRLLRCAALQQGNKLKGAFAGRLALIHLGGTDCRTGSRQRGRHGGAVHQAVGRNGVAQANAIQVHPLVIRKAVCLSLEHQRHKHVPIIAVGLIVVGVPYQILVKGPSHGIYEVDAGAFPSDIADGAGSARLISNKTRTTRFVNSLIVCRHHREIGSICRGGETKAGHLIQIRFRNRDLQGNRVSMLGVRRSALVGRFQLLAGDRNRTRCVEVVVVVPVVLHLVLLFYSIGAIARIHLNLAEAIEGVVGHVARNRTRTKPWHIGRFALAYRAHDHRTWSIEVGALFAPVAVKGRLAIGTRRIHHHGIGAGRSSGWGKRVGIDILGIIARCAYRNRALLANFRHGKIKGNGGSIGSPGIVDNANVHTGIQRTGNVRITFQRRFQTHPAIRTDLHRHKLYALGGPTGSRVIPLGCDDSGNMGSVAANIHRVVFFALGRRVDAVLAAADLVYVSRQVNHVVFKVGVGVIDARINRAHDAAGIICVPIPSRNLNAAVVFLRSRKDVIRPTSVAPLVVGNVGHIV